MLSPKDLDEIAIFVKVVQAGSFIGASRLLNVPRSTVSRKVADLEEALGVRLLQRTTRKLHLTESGALYFERCVRALSDIEEANLAIAQAKEIPHGTLRVSASVVFGVSVLHRWVAEFMAKYPQVSVEVLLTNDYVDVVARGIDVAVRAGPLPESSLVAKSLGTIPYWLCASPQYIQAKGIPSSPHELSQHSCMNIMSGTFSEIISWTMKRGKEEVDIRLNDYLRVNDFLFLKTLALNHHGIAFIPSIAVTDEVEAGRLLRVLSDWTIYEREIFFVYASERHLSPKVRAFVELVEQNKMQS